MAQWNCRVMAVWETTSLFYKWIPLNYLHTDTVTQAEKTKVATRILILLPLTRRNFASSSKNTNPQIPDTIYSV